MAFLAGMKAALVSGKVWLVGALLVVVFFSGYYRGVTSSNEDNVQALKVFIEQERDRSFRAVAAASKAARQLEQVRSTGDEQVEEMEQYVVDSNCVPSPDELRLLEEIATGRVKEGSGVLSPSGD